MGATGELKVSVNPADPPATVKIDGRPRGPTPLSAELNAGKHTVVIERPGSKKYTKQVKVPLAGIFTLNADLEPE